jgi:hypothetical protein
MSQFFGPVIQQGYVVPDIQAAMEHWLSRGVGPFFIEEHIRPPGEYDGAAIQADISAAFAYSGDQQIEVIQPFDDTQTIYRDYLDENPAGGLQHLAVWVDSIPEKLDEIAERKLAFRVRQRYGDMHAYLDSVDRPGVMIQLMAHNEFMDTLFEMIKIASIEWDGVTDPIRKIDWSTGTPRVS